MSSALPEVTVEKIVPGAYGLARLDGRVVLLRGAIPGERVRVRLDRAGKGGVQFGEIAEVLEPSPDRVEPATDPRCGGLALAHVRVARQRELKRDMLVDALRRTGGLTDLPPIDVVASPSEGWRMRARLHVHRGHVGFYREGSHELCRPPTSQLPPPMLQAAEAVLAWTPEAMRPAVAEIVVADDLDGRHRAVHLVLRHPATTHGWPVQPPDGVAGVSLAWRGMRRPRDIAGRPEREATLADLGASVASDGGRLRWHPAAFFQANRAIVPRLVSRIVREVAARPVVELFAGVGLFGLCAAASGSPSVVCVEGDPVAARSLRQNAEALDAPGDTRLVVHEASVEAYVAEHAEALNDRVLVVDPPRTGLPTAACDRIAAARPAALVYVSCDAPTLARDLRRLRGAGFRLRAVEAFDMFPETAHLETLAVLDPPVAQ